jgi:nucleoside-diphosphate-sugar epimerase
MAPTWVVRPMQAIKLKKIALIDGGCGIFHHTYIDNLVDVLVQTMDTRDIDGEIFNITDGDNSVTWKRYFDDLCLILGLQPIDKDFSSSFAKLLGHIMLFRERFFGISPLITPYAVEIFANTTKVFIEKAQQQLDYAPRIEYEEGIIRIEQWINEQGIDSII